MSIKIIKKGLADSLQDKGRYGYQHLGIQPNGCMDFMSAWLANSILQNEIDQPVFELHFPTSHLKFEDDYTICISGANFVPVINEKSIAMNCAISVSKNDVLSMLQPIEGKTAYLAIKGFIQEEPWLGSHAYSGVRLEKEDQIHFTSNNTFNELPNPISNEVIESIQKQVFDHKSHIRFIPGPAWNELNQESITHLIKTPFYISSQANRMGFTLSGPTLNLNVPNHFLSSAVTRGTMQLLPNGEIIVLMADHQTIGGYANLGQIILVDLPRFAQMKTNMPFHFALTNLDYANQLYREIHEQFKH